MKNVWVCSLLLVIVSLAACDRLTVAPELTLDNPEDSMVDIHRNGYFRYVVFNSSLPWQASVIDGSAWLKVTPEEGEAGESYIMLDADANYSPEKRYGMVEISSSGVSLKIKVGQESAFVEVFELSESAFEVPAEGGKIELRVRTNNINYYVDVIDDWIAESVAKTVNEYVHVFDVSPNPSEEQRTGTVTFCAGQLCRPVTVTQAGKQKTDENENGGSSGGGNIENGDGDWTTSSFKHRSLAVRVTADWCGYCPIMATTFETALSMRPDGLELVSLHASGGLAFSSASSMISQFHVTGYPTAILDGRAKMSNYSGNTGANCILSVADETESFYPTTSGIAMTSSLDERTLSVDLSVYFKKADEYKVTVLLLEDAIYGYQNGGGYNYRHDHVVRMALSPALGEEISVETDGSVWSKTYSAEVPSGCDLSNLKVLAYVQKRYGDQTVVENVYLATYGDYGDWYVDNARSCEVGTSNELEYQ